MYGRFGINGFREDFKKSANQKQELPVAAMLGKWIITIGAHFREDLP
jgi:hypothetical protein